MRRSMDLDAEKEMKSNHSESGECRTTKVLLADTNRWDLAARLAVGLAEAGCQVTAICPSPSHALMKTRVVRRTFRYSGSRPLESLRAAIESVDPDVIIPSCERSVEHLHELYLLEKERGGSGNKIVALIERSLGSPASHAIVSSRFDLLAIAREEGVRVPRTARILSPEDIDEWQKQEALPWVVKADGTWGGVGVRIVESAQETTEACSELTKMSRLTRAVKRLVVNRDPFVLRSWWRRSKRRIVVQSYIYGRPANCTVFCWNGKVLALIGVTVIRSDGATGPASIVRIVDNAEMKFAAERIAGRLGLSGFFGLDFMIEEKSNAAYLIEMNPRLTPPCYLRLGIGHDLPGALWAQLAGRPLPDVLPVTQNDLIAYLPQALKGNQDVLAGCYRDLPKDEPDLVKELLNPFPDRTVLFRLVQFLSRKSAVGRDREVQQRPVDGRGKESKPHLPGGGTSESPLESPIDEVRARST